MDIYFIYETSNVTWSNVSERWELLPREHSMWCTAEPGRWADRLSQKKNAESTTNISSGSLPPPPCLSHILIRTEVSHIHLIYVLFLFDWFDGHEVIVETPQECVCHTSQQCRFCIFCLCKSTLIHFKGSTGQELCTKIR